MACHGHRTRNTILAIIIVNSRPHHSSSTMRPNATDEVAWYVSLLVTFVRPAKRLDHSRCRLEAERPRNHLLAYMEQEIANGKGKGFQPTHGTGSLCCDVCCKTDHSDHNNGTTWYTAFRQNSLTTYYYYYCYY